MHSADITHAVGTVNELMTNPGKLHWEEVKWNLKYLKSFDDHRLEFGQKGKEFRAISYIYSDYKCDLNRRKFTTRYIFSLDGSTISCRSVLQDVVASSTTEAEYMIIHSCN